MANARYRQARAPRVRNAPVWRRGRHSACDGAAAKQRAERAESQWQRNWCARPGAACAWAVFCQLACCRGRAHPQRLECGAEALPLDLGGKACSAPRTNTPHLAGLRAPAPRSGNQGVDALCRALRHNSFLRELDVGSLQIDDKAATAIAQVGGTFRCAGRRGAMAGGCSGRVGRAWRAGRGALPRRRACRARGRARGATGHGAPAV